MFDELKVKLCACVICFIYSPSSIYLQKNEAKCRRGRMNHTLNMVTIAVVEKIVDECWRQNACTFSDAFFYFLSPLFALWEQFGCFFLLFAHTCCYLFARLLLEHPKWKFNKAYSELQLNCTVLLIFWPTNDHHRVITFSLCSTQPLPYKPQVFKSTQNTYTNAIIDRFICILGDDMHY